MRCVICNGNNIEMRGVEEEVRINNNVVLIPIETLVCLSCGERYYDRLTMKFLEKVIDGIKSENAFLEPVGQVLRAAAGA
jgi:YgiT-type zinc finger domain-containing protein